MTTVTITAPNPKYDGTSAGVKFSEGKATIELPRQQAALEYFGRHRFGISENVAAPKGEDADLGVQATGSPAPGAAPTGAPAAPVVVEAQKLEDLTRAEIDALAAERGIDTSGAKTKADAIALIDASPAVPVLGDGNQPADVAGEGPAGAQHNVGHDGADPGNVGTPTTPTDATI
jgi:hypothetical protein